MSRPVQEAITSFLELWDREGEPWGEALGHVEEARRLFASLIGARPGEVAVTPGATYGFNALVSMLRLGGNAVAGPANFPTTYYTLHALRRRGVLREVRIVKPQGEVPSLEDWERAIDDETSLVVADHVSWITGYMEDLKALAEVAHRHGAVLVTDAFHSVGVVPVDVKRLSVDGLVVGSYKWLMGPHGAGFAYASPSILDGAEPLLSGWMAIRDGVLDRYARGERLFERPLDIHGLAPAGDARVMEWGTWPILALEGLLASLKHMIMGLDAPGRYESHTRVLVERLMDGLEELGYTLITPRASKAGIVTFRHRDPYQAANMLAGRGIIVSPRPGRIRVSPHFYNTREEIEALLDALGRRW